MMVEREDRHQVHPLAPADAYGRSDMESAFSEEELRRQKRKKYIKYGIAFAVFQVIMLSVMATTVMKFKTPKFRLRSASFDSTFLVGNSTNPSFNILMNAELGVKNTNFGPFKYRDTTVDFYYRNTKVSDVFVQGRTASLLSTKKVDVNVYLSSNNVTSTSELASDINSGILPLSSQSRMRGKVTIMLMMKKNRSSNMNCTMELALATKQLQNVRCK